MGLIGFTRIIGLIGFRILRVWGCEFRVWGLCGLYRFWG